MTDIVDKATRSKMMSRIKSKNTKIELIIRSGLHRRGYRFRLHRRSLPGKPDLCLPKYQAIIFIHGCFWHMHGCHLTTIPKTRPEFWRNKLSSNRKRDLTHGRNLGILGYRVLTIWECALRKKSNEEIENVLDHVVEWLKGSSSQNQIPSKATSSEFIL